MRKAHYWKMAGPCSAPSELIVVDTETWHGDATLTPHGEWQTLRIGCAIAYRLERGRRTRIKRITFTDASDFWNLVYSRLSRQRPVWIVGHNLPYDLGVLGGWRVICGDDYTADKVCISGQMFFVKGHYKGMRLNFLDTVNYYHCSLAKIGKSVGVEKMQMPVQTDDNDAWAKYCMNDVEVTARGIEAIIEYMRKHMLGPFQPTIASAAFAAYRSGFMREKVLVHDDIRALHLERDAYYGGIVETAYVGRCPTDRVYELDVCSMYPSCCQLDLPVKIKGYSERMGIARIRDLAETYLVFADVTVKDSPVQYPVRHKSGTYYPCGTYRTSLAHPELMDAIARGLVTYVHRVSWYTRAPIFREYMEFFVSHKIKYASEANDAMANICKLYATNLYGKTGQVTPRWGVWGRESLELLEQSYDLPVGALEYWYDRPPDMYHTDAIVCVPELPEPIQCRTDFGVLEIRTGEHESRDSCPAIAACVTSYARILLRSYQHIAGKGHWYYSDTDSIWTDEIGRDRLADAGCIQPQTLGRLDQKHIHEYMIVHGPKDYETDIVVRMKGIRVGTVPNSTGGYEQLQFPGALSQIRSGMSDGVLVERVTKHLSRTITRCVVLDSGYTRPLVYPGESPDNVDRSIHSDT